VAGWWASLFVHWLQWHVILSQAPHLSQQTQPRRRRRRKK